MGVSVVFDALLFFFFLFFCCFFFFFLFLFFFFFKQKTAYEIYQCDWSSDVCSSDLLLFLEIVHRLLIFWFDLLDCLVEEECFEGRSIFL